MNIAILAFRMLLLLVLQSTTFSYSQPNVEQKRIGRCVDNRAIRDWVIRADVITFDSWEHDGKSWRQRESEFSFRVIGLKPNDVPYVAGTIPFFPTGFDKFGPTQLPGLIDCNLAHSADELHYNISRVCSAISTKEELGPLACRTTAVLMKNTGGAGGVPGLEMEITKDKYPDPLELHLHFQYLDPDAAAAYIKKREEESK